MSHDLREKPTHRASRKGALRTDQNVDLGHLAGLFKSITCIRGLQCLGSGWLVQIRDPSD